MSARLFLVLVLLSAAISFAQEQGSPPRTDLLTMNGGKPNLSATDDGITSYKTDEIYERGTTRVRRLKPAEVKFKIELPFGYTLFNDLLFAVETDTVVTGPSDITFHLPSARSKERRSLSCGSFIRSSTTPIRKFQNGLTQRSTRH